MKFCFGDIVVVENNLIGVVVKSWINLKNLSVNSKDREVRHEVYVRYFNEIREYPEELIERYMVRPKYLEGEEITWQNNAVNNTINKLQSLLSNNYYTKNQVDSIYVSTNNAITGQVAALQNQLTETLRIFANKYLTIEDFNVTINQITNSNIEKSFTRRLFRK